MSNILYFDCLAGISGDMTLGALLDLGIDQECFRKEMSKLNIEGVHISIDEKVKEGIRGLDVHVHDHHHHHDDHEHNEEGHHHHEHRNLKDIQEIIDNSDISTKAKELSKAIFYEVAVAEATVHGKSIDNIHFHEVGAIDSIVDIVGAAVCIDLLEIDHVYASPLHLGTGFVNCAHGTIPIPAPATLEILKGIPVYQKGIESELVTPTGAAIIKVLADEFIPMPQMELDRIGYGMGDHELPIKNMLRVFKGKKKLHLGMK